MALNSMYCVDVPLHAASGLFMFTLPPKRGTTRKQKLIKKAELASAAAVYVTWYCMTDLLAKFTLFVAFLILMSAIYLANKRLF